MAAIGGVYFESPAALSNGQEAEVLIDSRRRLVVVPSGSGAGGSVVAGLVYNASPPAVVDGASSPLQGDSLGNLRVVEQFAPYYEDAINRVAAIQVKPLASSTYAPSVYVNYGAAVTANVKATGGNLLAVIEATNINAAVRYLQIHDTATTPSAAAVPKFSFVLPQLTGVITKGQDAFTVPGVNFVNGIAFAFSTTQGTYTAATAADHSIQLLYI